MAANTKISTAAENAAVDAITALLNGGSLKIYDGTQPAGPGTAVSTQTLLVTLTLGATAFNAASGGSATNQATTPGTAVASSTPTWARWAGSGGTAVMDCSAGPSGADLTVMAIATGNVVSLAAGAFTLTHPA